MEPRRQRRRSSSSYINSGVVVIILSVVAVAFIFFIISSFLSFTSQIFRPNSEKKSWNSLNLVLVVFAIVCGFLSRNTGNNRSSQSTATRSVYEEDYMFENRLESFQKSNPGTPRKFWYDHHHNSYNGTTTLNRWRSSSSYPDLRQEEASWTSRDDYQWRFCGDTRWYNYGSSSFQQPQQNLEVEDSSGVDYLPNYPWLRPPLLKVEVEEEEKEKENVKNKEVDASMEEEKSRKEVIYTPQPTETAPYPRPRQSEAKVRRKVRRTCQDHGKKVKGDHQNENATRRREVSPPLPPLWSAPIPPPPAPPPPLPMFEESGKNEKRGGVSSTKEFLTSFRRKKKKQRQKSVENLDSFFNNESSYPLTSIPPPSPPPPPPPPTPPFFHKLFSSKKRKAKKIHSVVPTPPPPRSPRTKKLSVSASESKVESKNVSFTTQKPPLQVKIKNYNNVEENANHRNESPMNAIPPPPPLPPFKMPAWKFEEHGDFVRLKSTIDEDVEESSNPSESGNAAATDGGDGALTPLFCPSPDVNTKAANFIARFRADLRFEKMNSVKEEER